MPKGLSRDCFTLWLQLKQNWVTALAICRLLLIQWDWLDVNRLQCFHGQRPVISKPASSAIVHITLSSVKANFFHYMMLTAFMHMKLDRLSFNHWIFFILPRIVSILLKINIHAFHAFWDYIFIPWIRKVLKPNTHFTLKMDSDLCCSLTGSNRSQTCTLLLHSPVCYVPSYWPFLVPQGLWLNSWGTLAYSCNCTPIRNCEPKTLSGLPFARNTFFVRVISLPTRFLNYEYSHQMRHIKIKSKVNEANINLNKA
jgi:hypothetical protein